MNARQFFLIFLLFTNLGVFAQRDTAYIELAEDQSTIFDWDDLTIDPAYSADPKPDVYIEVDEEPKVLNLDSLRKWIGYPEIARMAELVGKVVLRVLVNEQGKYVKHILLKDPHPILSNAVINQISKAEFSPAMKSGDPISYWVNIPIDFQLPKAR